MKTKIDKMELKKITSDVMLVIFDFYNTLVVNSNGNLKLKEGAFELITRLRLRGKIVAVSSTSPLKEISEAFEITEIAGIKPFLNSIYGNEHILEEQGQIYKNLGQICQDLEVLGERAVFIGDDYDGIDTRSAERFNIPLIIVPRDSKYNLTQLIEINKK